ncbi:YHS domain protein [Planctomycetes bacterium MalM25]|nr:YHS domain protein [Planctomycetes bacterium MalM25]
MAASKVGLDGYCPVCQVNMKQWMAGSSQHQAAYDGVIYRFPGAEQKAMFQADPAKYAPALAGDDVVAYARTGRRTPGKTAYGARYLDRLYFFGTEANKEAFRANPAQFANADLALGGECAVCRVDMNASMAGAAQFTTLHNGLRYQFAGAQQKQLFDSNPRRYAVTPLTASPVGSGRVPAGSGSGSGGR